MSKKTSETVLILRASDKNLRSHGGFQWPASGPVEAPDWLPTKECGNGLHGLLWGIGDYGYLSSEADAKWHVVEVVKADVLDLDDKVKFPRGNVLFSGTSREALALLSQAIANRKDSGLGSTTGDAAHSSTTGDAAHSSTTGYAAHSSTTGRHAHSSTTGDAAVASCLGYGGTAKAQNGVLVLAWHDGKRRRLAVGYTGENGIKPDVFYCLDDDGNFIEAQD